MKPDLKRAAALRKLAGGLDNVIADKQRPMTQNSTPKRDKEYNWRRLEGDNWERAQRALRALAGAWERGDVPAILVELKKKDEFYSAMRFGTIERGYYSVCSSGKYAATDARSVALQMLTEGSLTADDQERAAAAKHAQALREAESALVGCNIPGFFPTPLAVCAKLLEVADIQPNHIVLEPQAGKGDVADAIRETHPACRVVCIEIRDALRTILELKGHTLVGRDFLEFEPGDVEFDRIVMNPPFEKGAEILHVRKAFDVVRQGGRVVSVMSEGPFFRTQKADVAFRDWMMEVGATTFKLPEGSFMGAGAFRRTGTAMRVFTADKPSVVRSAVEMPDVPSWRRSVVGKMRPAATQLGLF